MTQPNQPQTSQEQWPEELIQFETTWGRVKCHDDEYVWFPRFFSGSIASIINQRKTFVALTFEKPIDVGLIQSLQQKVAELEAENEKLKVNLNTCKNDYWFMSGLLERSALNHESVKDCIYRMNFRKPIFNFLKGEEK